MKSVLMITSTLNYPARNGLSMRMLDTVLELAAQGDYTFSFMFYKNNPALREQVVQGLKAHKGVEVVEAFNQPLVNFEQMLDVLEYNNLPVETYARVSRELEQGLKNLLKRKQFDIIQVEESQMGWLIPLIREYAPKAKVVLALHDIQHIMWRRRYEHGNENEFRKYVALRLWKKIEEWEKQVWSSVDGCFAISHVEAELFKQLCPQIPIKTIPIAIDLDKYTYKRDLLKKYDIVYIGGLSYFPALHGLTWFVDKVLPLITAKMPEVKFHIIGSGAPYGQFSDTFVGRSDIVFWGEQEDERPFLHEGRVFVVPLEIASGARLKIPIAWSCGIPVVSTTIGAEGHYYDNGRDIDIADDACGFAEAVIKILADGVYGDCLSQNARKRVEEHYSLDGCTALQKELYDSLLK